MQDSPPAGTRPASRRGFFFGAAAAGAVATAFAVLPKMQTPGAMDAEPGLKPAPEKGGGYSLSEHVKRYYRTAST